MFGAFYAIDFLTLGKLKKLKRFSKIYFPIYVFFSWLSLAPIYRSAYYTLVTNIKSWKLLLGIVIYATLAVVYTLDSHPENNYKQYLKNHTIHAIHRPAYYDNLRGKMI